MSPNVPDNLNSFIDILREFPGASVSELAYHTGMVERTVKRYIKQLREAGILIRVGTNRKGYWSIKMPED